jgi:hypothetical protein
MSASPTKISHRKGAARAAEGGEDSCCGGGAERAGSAEDQELRCACGSLLARYVDGKVELKCRRCKRTIWIPVSAEGEHGA